MAVANVDVRVDSTGAVRSLNQLNAASRATTAGVNGLKAAIAPLLSAFAAIQATKFVIAKTAELETQTRSIQTLTGSVTKAKQIIQELQQIGAVTPFTSTELIDSAKRLTAFGVSADKVVETTKRLGDVAGATGANLGELSLAYGQVQAKGRLQGEELLQFQERGVALQDELRKMYGLTGEEFSKALSKGQISAEAVEVALQRLTNTGGKYANGAIAQSDTLAGRFSTLQDGVETLARTVGTALMPAIKAVLNEAVFAINTINQLIGTGARAKSFGMGQAQRQQVLRQAQNEAERIVNMRRIQDPFERNRQFQELAAQRERDLIESYGYRTGQIKPPAQPIRSEAAANALTQQLLGRQVGGGGGGGGGGTDKAQRERERAAEAAAEEQSRVAKVIRDRMAEAEMLETKLRLAAQINAAETSGDQMLAERLRGQQALFDLQYKYAQQLADEKDIKAQEAIIHQGTMEMLGAQFDTEYKLQDLQKQRNQDQMNALQALIEKQYEMNTAVQQQEALANSVSATLGQSMTSAFDLLIKGAESWSASLKQIASSALVDIANQLIRIYVIEQAVNAIQSFLTPFVPGKTPIGAGGGMKGRFGTLGPNYGIPQRATGGSVTGGQPYLVGERGPELFMPGRSGGIAPSGSFGGGPTVVVNVDASGTSVQGNQPEGQALGRAVAAAVQAELIKQKRPGGILA